MITVSKYASLIVCSFSLSIVLLFMVSVTHSQSWCESIKWKVLSSVQLLSHVRLSATPWTAARQASLSIPTPGVYSSSHTVVTIVNNTVLYI